MKTEEKLKKLQAFKDYVHKRLDEAGVEKEPDGVHSKQGCRIGDRLDIVLGKISYQTGIPPYDGLYLAYTEEEQVCGNLTGQWEAVYCDHAKWVTDKNVIAWTYQPDKPDV